MGTARVGEGRARRSGHPGDGRARLSRVRAQGRTGLRGIGARHVKRTRRDHAVFSRRTLTLPPVPWRDPHTVSPADLSAYIQKLEQACLDNPRSADLRTCLGMAYAVNYDVYKSMDALEEATAIDPDALLGAAQIRGAALPAARAEPGRGGNAEGRRPGDQPVAAGAGAPADEGDSDAAAHERPERPLDQAADGAGPRAFRDAGADVRRYDVEMNWKFFIGSCILATGLLFKAGRPSRPHRARWLRPRRSSPGGDSRKTPGSR